MSSEVVKPLHVARASAASGFGFFVVIVFLIFEYGRPQDRIGLIGVLRPTIILIALLGIAWLRSGNLQRAASPQMLRMVLMLLLLALHVPFARNNFYAYNVTLGYLLLLPLCLSIVLYVDSVERLRSFMKWWIALAAYIAVNGILGGGIAGSSFLYDENDFSLLMNVMLPFAYFLFVYERKKGLKLAYLAASLLCVVSIVASGSRGGFIGLIAVLGVIWLVSPRKILSLALVGVLALGVFLAADQKYWDRMSTIENTNEGTAKQRLDSWEAGWDMFTDNPLGVGPGNFPVRFPEYQPGSFQRGMWGRQAHSLWFTLLPELGIPGLMLYLSLLMVTLRDVWHLRKQRLDSDERRFGYFLSLAFIASLAGFFASGTFVSVLYYPHYWYLTAMIVATRKVIGSAEPAKPGPPSRRGGGA
jgi:probable O-glycosylation ligase (exosortase A-associated)